MAIDIRQERLDLEGTSPGETSQNGSDAIERRRQRFEHATGVSLDAVHYDGFNEKQVAANIEKLVGAVHVPLGIAGPITVRGDHADGPYHVPFATTEGTLVAGYTLSMLGLSKAGGVRVKVLANKVDITPVFELETMADAVQFGEHLKRDFEALRGWCESTTRYGKLLEVRPVIMGRRVYVHFVFDPKDAMGMNMISFATHEACERLLANNDRIKQYYLRSNLSADKKPAYSNFVNGFGKEVVAECTLPRKIAERYFRSTPEAMADFWHASALSGFQAGTMGHNAQFGNALAAIYIATGQDVAQVTNAASGIFSAELTPEGELYCSMRLPSLIVATVGGGTGLPSQRACLELMDCAGAGHSDKFAEIVAATLFAGELSIGAALASGEFIHAHRRKREHAQR